MKTNRKPRVTVKCVANNYAASFERIVEYSFPGSTAPHGYLAGGLISFTLDNDGNPHVSLYRHDANVQIHVGQADA